MSSWARKALPAAAALLLLCGCAATPVSSEETAEAEQAPSTQAPKSRPRIVMERRPGTGDSQAQTEDSQTIPAARGTGKLYAEPEAPAPKAASDQPGMQLAFIETDIAAVLASVLGDALGYEYVIDPRVKGTMTLQSTGSIGRDQLFAALEAALRLQDIALVPSETGYRIVPIRDAPRYVPMLRTPESRGLPGYGVEVVPLRFASAVEIEKVLQPLAAPGSVLRIDEARSLILIAGTTQERAALIDVIRVFDTDVMAGMSFQLFQLEHVEAKVLAGELTEVLGSIRSSLPNVVKVVPLRRLNAILGVSSQPEYLDQLGAWVRRLDIPPTAPERRIHVYDVQNGKAGDLAAAIGRVLSDESPLGADSAPAAGAPDATAGRTASTARPAAAGAAWESGGLRVVPSDENNSLLIFASPTEYAVLEGALAKLDVPPRQVLIEATLAEVTLNEQLRFGIQWFHEFGNGTVTLSQSNSGGVASQFPGFSYVFTGSTRVDAVLNALETVTNVKVVSKPKLMVLNNHQAQLQVGDQVPVVSQSSVSVNDPDAPIVNSVQMRDTGVILSVTPRVNKSGLVLLDVSQEVSDVIPTTTSGIDSPTIQQRRLSSTVAVHSGQTIALGGLIRETTNDNQAGLPWIQRIPLLGRLFGASDIGSRRTELIILLTPRLVRDLSDTRELTDYLREQFKTLNPAIQ